MPFWVLFGLWQKVPATGGIAAGHYFARHIIRLTNIETFARRAAACAVTFALIQK